MADERQEQYIQEEIRRLMPVVDTRDRPESCDEYRDTTMHERIEDLTAGEIDRMKEKRRQEMQERRTADNERKQELQALREEIVGYGPKSMRRQIRDYGESSIEAHKILFTGPSGAGVTSVIHLMERALRNAEGPTDARAGVPTQYFTEHFTDLNYIRAFDCPPMEYENGETIMNTLINVVKGNVQVQEKLDPETHGQPENDDASQTPLRVFHDLFKRFLLIVFVLPYDMMVNIQKRRLLTERYKKIWVYLRAKGYGTACIVTGGDKLTEEYDRERLEALARQTLNAPANDGFVVVLRNYETYSPIRALEGVRFPPKANYEEEVRALKFLKRIVGSCEVRLEERIAEAKNKAEDEPRSSDPSIHPDTHLRTFLVQQNKWNKWRRDERIFKIAEMFAERDIFNFEGLRACYESVSELLDEGSSIPRPIRQAIRGAVQQISTDTSATPFH